MGSQYRYANDLATEYVDHGSDVDPFPFELEIGEVTGVDVTDTTGFFGHQQVREHTILGLLIHFLGSTSVWFDTELVHHSEDSFLVDAEMQGETFVPV